MPEIPTYRPRDPEYGQNTDGLEFDQIDYGYRLPDGSEYFGDAAKHRFPIGQALDLSTYEGQALVQQRFAEGVAASGLVYDEKQHGKPVFLQRRKSVRYAKPTPLSAEVG